MISIVKQSIIFLFIVTLTACSIFSRPNNQLPVSASDANVQLGLAYLNHGDVQRAHQKLLLAEEQAPRSLQAQGAMGYFLESTGNFSSADAYYRRAIALNPKSGAAQNNYGTFLCRRGRYSQADQHFLLALQDPSYLNAAQVNENAGLCAMQIPNTKKAIGYFMKAISQDPKLALSWLELGRINYQAKNYQQAQQYLDHYMQLVKAPTANALWLGAVLARALGNPEVAANYTLMLQTKFPNSDAYKALIRTPTLKAQQKKDKQLYF
ncbi:type IV pilus biogenesis/stability protein PilW [Rickettsiella grylli]|uniref:type IV pilus biogenesis/stability protein PilW n=1 Tax=Rickettsiella grylli TaxID=59196 RepID=UPI0008FD7104|nr:type IV pilus biogenesis/stability protein PilW [Rickettsiella grylli]OJA00814.1 type IV pilus biogenesis/stability protein PilW [Rickettsiella grylli]